MFPVQVIMAFFLSKEKMSPKKLQKLLYYAYAWTLTLLNENINEIETRLFNEKIQAWIHGPVIPSVYDIYKRHGWNTIPKDTEFECLTQYPDILDILEQVWNVYGKYTGNQLEELTHQEDPWIQTRGDFPFYEACTSTISDQEIFKYYITESCTQ